MPLLRHCPERPACGCPGPPESLCPMFSEMARRLTRQIVALPHIRSEHGVAVGEYVGAYIRSRVIDLFLQRVGMLKMTGDGLDAHPAMVKSRGHLSLLLARLSDQLGLNPASAKLLGLTEPIDVGGGLLLQQLRREAQSVPEGEE